LQGLLPILKPITKARHLREYRGKAVAVDGYSWLHKGAYACSKELCEGRYTDRFVNYCMSRVELLRGNGVIPIMVFDGGRLPMKAEEEETRRRCAMQKPCPKQPALPVSDGVTRYSLQQAALQQLKFATLLSSGAGGKQGSVR
jgi:hypothetical protein